MADVKHDLGLRAMKALNVALITASFAVCWYLYYAPRTSEILEEQYIVMFCGGYRLEVAV